MAWVVFTPDEFRTWHDQQCALRNIPQPGRLQSDQTIQVDNEWTTAWVQPAYTATIKNKTYYAVQLPDTEDVTGLRTLDDLTVNQTTKAITVVFQGDSYTATPATIDASKPKPLSITIDGITYTRTR